MTLLVVEPTTFPIARLLYGGEPRDGELRFASHTQVLSEETYPAGSVLLSGVEALPIPQQEALCQALREKRALSRVYNWPSTGPRRFAHLRALHAAGFNEFHAWLGPEVLEANKFPLVLRQVDTGTVLSPIIASREGLLHACAKLQWQLDAVLGVELCMQRGADDLYRKYSSFVVGKTTIPVHLHLSRHWLVRGKDRVTTRDAELEEAEYLAVNPHHEQLCRAAGICAVDFARVDYVISNGRAQVYEFNMTPGLGVPAGQEGRESFVRSALRRALSAL